MSTKQEAVQPATPFSASAAPLARAAARVAGLLSGKQAAASELAGAITAFAVRVASAGLLYLSQVILARWMGTFEYGIYVLVWTWVLVLGGLSTLGLSTLVIRLVPEHRERGEIDLLRGLLRYGRLLPLAAATIVALVALAVLHAGDTTAPYVLPAAIGLACVPMIAVTDVQDGIGRARGWMNVALVPPYVLRPLLILLAIGGVHVAGGPMTAVMAAAVAVVATWAATGVQSLLLARSLRAEVPPGPARAPPGLWMGTSLPLLAIGFSELLLQNADVLVISRYLDPAEVGIYFAAAKTMSLVMFVHYAVGSAMARRFAALNARGDAAGLRVAVRQAVQWTFWPSLAAAVGILALSKPLLSLFGPQFQAGYPVMLVLVVGFIGRAAMGPSELLLNMLGQQRATAAAAIFVAILNVGLNLVLVPTFGLLGAATATALALVTGAALNTAIARQRLGLRIGIWSNLRVW